MAGRYRSACVSGGPGRRDAGAVGQRGRTGVGSGVLVNAGPAAAVGLAGTRLMKSRVGRGPGSSPGIMLWLA